jgi:hypothetical protein
MDLQEDALKIIKKYCLLERIDRVAEAHLVGSVALKVTVKPDIDLQVFTQNQDRLKVATQIKQVLEKEGFDNVVVRELKKSDKFLVTTKFIFNDIYWTLDVSVTERKPDYLNNAYKFYQVYGKKINNKNRETIIRLKKHFLKEGKLKDSMSYYIYRSVIDGQAKRPAEVIRYKNKEKKK